jgi:hypothetical protein
MVRPGADYVAPGKNQNELWSGFRIDYIRGFGFRISLGYKMMKFTGIDLQERLTVFVPEINAQLDESTKCNTILMSQAISIIVIIYLQERFTVFVLIR